MVRAGAWATPCASPTTGGRPAVADGNCEEMGSTWVMPFSNDERALRRDPRPAVQVRRRALRFRIRVTLKRSNTAVMNARRRITTMAAMTPDDGPEDVLSPARTEFVVAVISGVTLPG
jgi:hypothetical protein